MNRFLILTLLAGCAPLAHAQKAFAPATSAAAPDIARWVNAPGVALRQSDGTKLPVTIAAVSSEAALLFTPQGGQQLLMRDEWNKLSLSAPLAPDAPTMALIIENAVQIVPITQLGADATVAATYTLRNTGTTPAQRQLMSKSPRLRAVAPEPRSTMRDWKPDKARRCARRCTPTISAWCE